MLDHLADDTDGLQKLLIASDSRRAFLLQRFEDERDGFVLGQFIPEFCRRLSWITDAKRPPERPA